MFAFTSNPERLFRRTEEGTAFVSCICTTCSPGFTILIRANEISQRSHQPHGISLLDAWGGYTDSLILSNKGSTHATKGHVRVRNRCLMGEGSSQLKTTSHCPAWSDTENKAKLTGISGRVLHSCVVHCISVHLHMSLVGHSLAMISPLPLYKR